MTSIFLLKTRTTRQLAKTKTSTIFLTTDLHARWNDWKICRHLIRVMLLPKINGKARRAQTVHSTTHWRSDAVELAQHLPARFLRTRWHSPVGVGRLGWFGVSHRADVSVPVVFIRWRVAENVRPVETRPPTWVWTTNFSSKTKRNTQKIEQTQRTWTKTLI